MIRSRELERLHMEMDRGEISLIKNKHKCISEFYVTLEAIIFDLSSSIQNSTIGW